MKNLLIKYVPFLFNKYVIATSIFLFILIFSERNGLINQWLQKKKYNAVLSENEYYKDEIKKMNEDYAKLFSNPKNLEKYAREKFFMKRDNEDVFIIEKK